MVNEENRPTAGSTPAMTENEIASGIRARATTRPASTSVRNTFAEDSHSGREKRGLGAAAVSAGMRPFPFGRADNGVRASCATPSPERGRGCGRTAPPYPGGRGRTNPAAGVRRRSGIIARKVRRGGRSARARDQPYPDVRDG
ncbi:hypothetical protein GCM10010420_46720 [Streptomyces glaucosporus]|uniref:Uncharacterized protein n=1 Tax=Streptomyces glaucosporus TaxID=284044 RepID=A0ABP5VXE7_9ACTN